MGVGASRARVLGMVHVCDMCTCRTLTYPDDLQYVQVVDVLLYSGRRDFVQSAIPPARDIWAI